MDRIDAMQAFVAVADLQGFAPAARKLGLSPSGVTRLIAALEDRLGARLLQRTTRSVTLTDVGARYLERARRILADVAEAESAAAGESARPSGQLVVSAPLGFGRLHVSPVMSAYLKHYPDVAGGVGGVGGPPPAYLKPRGEPKRPADIASHDTIQFGSTAALSDWRFL